MYIYDHATKQDIFDIYLNIIETLAASDISKSEMMVILANIRKIHDVVKVCEIVDRPSSDSRVSTLI